MPITDKDHEHPALPSPPRSELLTFQEAAHVLGVKYWQVQRLAKSGAIPTYSPFNSRKLVKLSDIRAHIDASRQGGDA